MTIDKLIAKIDHLFLDIMMRLFPKAYKELKGTTKTSITEYFGKFEKEHPILNKIELAYFIFSSLLKKLVYVPRKIKFFFQRGRRGYADCDLWYFGYYISGVIINALKDFKKDVTGSPEDITYEQWLKVLDNMIYSFSVTQKAIENGLLIPSISDLKKHPRKWKKYAEELGAKLLTEKEIKKYNKGMKLFSKYIFDLWD